MAGDPGEQVLFQFFLGEGEIWKNGQEMTVWQRYGNVYKQGGVVGGWWEGGREEHVLGGRGGGCFLGSGGQGGSSGILAGEKTKEGRAYCGSSPRYVSIPILVFLYTCFDSHMCMIVPGIHCFPHQLPHQLHFISRDPFLGT